MKALAGSDACSSPFLLELDRVVRSCDRSESGVKVGSFHVLPPRWSDLMPELPIIPKAEDDSGFWGFVRMMKTIFGWRAPEEAAFILRRVGQEPIFRAIDVLSSCTCIR
ncbi:hypothetical protein BS47DRAFT_778873 [Hydnum rufescens UP504]|uniref:Uncharacterized protein n=1 Tax=Hydnum rufescens UP504 TaxID=1448309 RepID=A0A9P6AD16_9AGAM|nr:hypothetical protein BS47DRAFT_778873 [Hydnum rufescens UP504]